MNSTGDVQNVQSDETAFSKYMCIVWGTVAVLPFLEEYLFLVHVGNGKAIYEPQFYLVQIAPLFLLLWALMILSFAAEQDVFSNFLRPRLQRLSRTTKALRKRAMYFLFAIPIVILVFFFTGEQGLSFLIETGIIGTIALPFVQLLGVAILIWIIGYLIKALGKETTDLVGVMTDWSFGLKTSVLFYGLLIAASFKLINTEGIIPESQVSFIFAGIKDFTIFFIIVHILYLGLYRLASYNKLLNIFQSKRGFLHFIILCVLIALIAGLTAFGSLSQSNIDGHFPEQWQKQYFIGHVYISVIGLLVIPIAGVLFWTLKRVAIENRLSA